MYCNIAVFDGVCQVRAASPGMRTGVIVASALGNITELEPDVLSVSSAAVTRDLIARAHRRNLEVHVWTENDVPLMNTMLSMTADNFITDDPKLLREVLRRRAAPSNVEKTLLQLADFAVAGSEADTGCGPVVLSPSAPRPVAVLEIAVLKSPVRLPLK